MLSVDESWMSSDDTKSVRSKEALSMSKIFSPGTFPNSFVATPPHHASTVSWAPVPSFSKVLLRRYSLPPYSKRMFPP